MDKKTVLRRNAKALRKSLDIEKLSQKAIIELKNHCIYKDAKNVMLFYPTKYEIDFRKLLKDNKKFYLPRVNGSNIDVCPYNFGDELIKSELGIEEPIAASVAKEVLDLVIVPALMADEDNYRLGYGGGYYDRFISEKSFKTVCVIPKELFVNKLPHEQYDIQVDCVIAI